jgi:hypothetical protein
VEGNSRNTVVKLGSVARTSTGPRDLAGIKRNAFVLEEDQGSEEGILPPQRMDEHMHPQWVTKTVDVNIRRGERGEIFNRENFV